MGEWISYGRKSLIQEMNEISIGRLGRPTATFAEITRKNSADDRLTSIIDAIMVSMRGVRDANGTGRGLRRPYRVGLTVAECLELGPRRDSAEQCLEDQRRSGGSHCPHCDSERPGRVNRKTMPFRHREAICRAFFSVFQRTVSESSQLGWQRGAIASTGHRSGSSVSRPWSSTRNSGTTPAPAWEPLSRLREAFGSDGQSSVGRGDW